MSSEKSPYKIMGISIGKLLDNKKILPEKPKKHVKDCQCKTCDLIRSGSNFAVTGNKTGGHW